MTGKDHFLLGFDNLKDINIIENAYNDKQGVTAEFNKNILNVINQKTGSNFNSENFEHLAFFNKEKSRIEMHLIAKKECKVWIQSVGKEIFFSKGETIHTENSHKYSIDMMRELALLSGLRVEKWHTDPKEWFTLAELRKREI